MPAVHLPTSAPSVLPGASVISPSGRAAAPRSTPARAAGSRACRAAISISGCAGSGTASPRYVSGLRRRPTRVARASPSSARGDDGAHAEQLADHVLGVRVVAFAEVRVADVARCGRRRSRRASTGSRTSFQIVMSLSSATGHVTSIALHRGLHVLVHLLEVELRRMDADDRRDRRRVYRSNHDRRYGKRALAVDARVRPEVVEDDLAREVGLSERRRVDPRCLASSAGAAGPTFRCVGVDRPGHLARIGVRADEHRDRPRPRRESRPRPDSLDSHGEPPLVVRFVCRGGGRVVTTSSVRAHTRSEGSPRIVAREFACDDVGDAASRSRSHSMALAASRSSFPARRRHAAAYATTHRAPRRRAARPRSRRACPRGATRLGRVAGGAAAHDHASCSQPSHTDELDALLDDLYDPASPRYEQWLTAGRVRAGASVRPRRRSPRSPTGCTTQGLTNTNGRTGMAVQRDRRRRTTVAGALGVSFSNYRLAGGRDRATSRRRRRWCRAPSPAASRRSSGSPTPLQFGNRARP